MLTPQKRRRRTNSGADGGASLARYQSLVASRLAGLQLPLSADGGDEPCSVDRPDLPSAETLEALTSRSFLDDEMRDALVEFKVHKCLSDQTHGRRQDSGEFLSADVAMHSVDTGDDIPDEQFVRDCEKLLSRRTPVDDYAKLDGQQLKELDLSHARFRIKALLLLKGKAIDKLDDAALEHKYPPELIVENSYFLGYCNHNAFGWFFDWDLSQLASLTDYQRLVLTNYCGDEYQDRNLYRSYYNNPETDRDYLLYWKTITEKLKWIEGYIYRGRTSVEWEKMKMKARHQAIRAATDFDHIHRDLAGDGFVEFIWSTFYNVLELKDLDGVFIEIWKLVIRNQVCFREAVKKVYDMKKFPSREQCMKDELDGKFRMEKKFRLCTVGITEQVPDYRARELIAQQIKNKYSRLRTYEQYAEKKLKIAEYLGLIGKTTT
uniref:Uncharacterized protein n=1 Tax=Avena sativa TaxID=4498 RepID=A0ACD5XEY4_AVESA